MRFQLPQFIEHEAKIMGPFTMRQSLYLGVPFIISFFVYFLLPFPIFLMVAIVSLGVALSFTFIKVGGQELPFVLWSAIAYFLTPTTFIWKKGGEVGHFEKEEKFGDPEKGADTSQKYLERGSKLKNLSFLVDTKR